MKLRLMAALGRKPVVGNGLKVEDGEGALMACAVDHSTRQVAPQ
jgi:hypothetical protein